MRIFDSIQNHISNIAYKDEVKKIAYEFHLICIGRSSFKGNEFDGLAAMAMETASKFGKAYDDVVMDAREAKEMLYND